MIAFPVVYIPQIFRLLLHSSGIQMQGLDIVQTTVAEMQGDEYPVWEVGVNPKKRTASKLSCVTVSLARGDIVQP